jgi:hypothetical protein
MKVPFLDLKSPYLELKEELDAAYQRVMESGWYILGKEVEAFESEFATYCETKHCIGVGNGLDALHLIVLGYGIGPGDEVIVPANTYIASWLAVTHVGRRLFRLSRTSEPVTLIRPGLNRPSRQRQRRSWQFTFTGKRLIWTRLMLWHGNMGSGLLRIVPKRTERVIRGAGQGGLAMQPGSVSIRARTLAQSGTVGR